MSSRGITRQQLQEVLANERQLLMADIDNMVWTAIPRLVPVGGDGQQNLDVKSEVEALKYSLEQKCNEVAQLRSQMVELSTQLRAMEQQIKLLNEHNARRPAPPNEADDLADVDVAEHQARILWIITEVGHAPCPKLEAKHPFNKTEVYEKVMGKIARDRASPESAVYRRNYSLFMHLTRRKAFSKDAQKTLVELWERFGISGDIVAFSGRMFDRDYLNPQSDKFFQYVTYLVFMHKYQLYSQPVTKHAIPCDSDEYFWRHW